MITKNKTLQDKIDSCEFCDDDKLCNLHSLKLDS